MIQRNPFSRKSPEGGDGAAGGTAGEAFVPTHTVPAWGLEIWNTPDMAREPAGLIAAGTEVRLLGRGPDGAVQVRARGGAAGWADGRHLEEIRAAAPSASADAMQFQSQLKNSLETYQRLLDDLAAQRIDYASFRRQAFDVGLMVGDGIALMLDLTSGRWHMYDGVTLRPMGPGWNPEQATEPATGKGK